MVRKKPARRLPARKPTLRKKKPEATAKDHGLTTHICAILDETGSMSDCRDATISGFNEFLQTQKNGADKATMTLSTFNTDSGVRVRYKMVPIKDARGLQAVESSGPGEAYHPSSTTPLYDAIARCIKAMDGQVGKQERVLCCIITDGQENASKEYTDVDIRKMIAEKEKESWTFTYIGANQDSWEAGRKMGMQAGNIANYKGDPHGTQVAYRAMSCNTTSLRGQHVESTKSFYSGGVTPDDIDQPKDAWKKAMKRTGVRSSTSSQ